MNNETYVTLRDVAATARVGLATASRALRDDPSTAAKTRVHVKKVAQELGYRPDPSMSQLIERRWRGKNSRTGINLGYIYNSKGHTGNVVEFDYQEVYKDAASALGYSLITEDISEFRNLKSLSNRLYSQGIKGLILPLLPSVPYDLKPLFKDYAAVSINVSEYIPECPIVMHDEFFSITMSRKILLQKGYRRIGMILPDYPESPTTNLRLGAALVCKEYTVAKDRIPILYLKGDESLNHSKFKKWMDKYKPDVLLANTHERAHELRKHGVRIPEDIPFSASNLWDRAERGKIAGFFRDNLDLFEQGIKLLNMMIRSGSTGAARANLVELVKGEWIDGDSLPDKHEHHALK